MASMTSPPTPAGSASASITIPPSSRCRRSVSGGTRWAGSATPRPATWSSPPMGGGSNGSRVRLWKRELQRLANELGIDIKVHHLPPGTSKWNKIEHRLFSFISMNWRAKPLVSYRVIVDLISATTTETGLSVRCELDPTRYATGITVSDPEMAAINLVRDAFHGEWNYTIQPQPQLRSDRAVNS